MRLAENTGRKKSPFWHHRTILLGCTFAAEACIDNRKKLLNTDTSPTCHHNMVNFGLLMAEICWRVCGTPANFNGFRVVAALLHGKSSSGRQPNFTALNRGRHLHSAGRPSRWALAHILVLVWLTRVWSVVPHRPVGCTTPRLIDQPQPLVVTTERA